MARVIRARVYDVDSSQYAAVQSDFTQMAAQRDWRDARPDLADENSRDFFTWLYFADAQDSSEVSGDKPLSAATFVRVKGDETDALALLFILREISEKHGLHIFVEDEDNPILKLRRVELMDGELAGGGTLESILVRISIFKKLRDGNRIEFFPPRALGRAFGTPEGDDLSRRPWRFQVHGMRCEAPTFLEAEAEAMRIYRGNRRLDQLGMEETG